MGGWSLSPPGQAGRGVTLAPAPCGRAPSIPPSRLGPSTGARTWPRSPRRGGFSSLGEWPGSGEGGLGNPKCAGAGWGRTHPQPLPAVGERDEVCVGGPATLVGWAAPLSFSLTTGQEYVTCCVVPPCPVPPPFLARWPPAHRWLLLAGQMSGPHAKGASPSSSPRHEDGTVRFWDASGVSLKPLYKLGTASIFQTDCEHDSLNQAGEEEWPPFRKVRSPGWRGRCCGPQHPPASAGTGCG